MCISVASRCVIDIMVVAHSFSGSYAPDSNLYILLTCIIIFFCAIEDGHGGAATVSPQTSSDSKLLYITTSLLSWQLCYCIIILLCTVIKKNAQTLKVCPHPLYYIKLMYNAPPHNLHAFQMV